MFHVEQWTPSDRRGQDGARRRPGPVEETECRRRCVAQGPATRAGPMRRILTIANQKGGVGKTTTAVNLAASLAAAERRTLLVDVDPQGNAGSRARDLRATSRDGSVYEVLLDGAPMATPSGATELKFLDLVPASRHLVGAELELAELEGRESRLREPVARPSPRSTSTSSSTARRRSGSSR